MIHITITIEPEGEEEKQIGIVSVSREQEVDNQGRYKYVYGGNWWDRDDDAHWFHGEVFESRKTNIIGLVATICKDIAENPTKEVRNE